MPTNPKPTRPLVISRINLGKTLNIENFENVRVDLTAEVAPDENWQEVLQCLRKTLRSVEKRLREDKG